MAQTWSSYATTSSTPQVNPVYEADEDDYEFDEFGNVVEQSEYHEEEFYEEGYEEGSTSTSGAVVSDVPDYAYWDDSALVHCWEAALMDFKYQHPTNFGPFTAAPRSMAQKQEAAPLWYGPAPIPKPKLQSKPKTVPKKRKSNASKSAASKKAKLDAPPSPRHTPSSPRYSPQSPQFQRALSLPPSTLCLPATATFTPEPPPHTERLPIAGPQLPSPSTFAPLPPPPSANLLHRPYPSPPPIVPLDGSEEVELETPEEMLQNALWAWYNAGYKTALYHAAMGVAGGGGVGADGDVEG